MYLTVYHTVVVTVSYDSSTVVVLYVYHTVVVVTVSYDSSTVVVLYVYPCMYLTVYHTVGG